jgi:hypothetical protein
MGGNGARLGGAADIVRQNARLLGREQPVRQQVIDPCVLFATTIGSGA